MFEIQKGIPMPERARFIPKAQKYPFDKMAVGDSFAVALGEKDDGAVLCRRVRNAAHRWRVQNVAALSFRAMTVAEDGKTVVRVWCEVGDVPTARPRKAKAEASATA